MKYGKLIKDIRLELSEAVVADKEKAYARARACLLYVKNLIEKNIVRKQRNG